MLFSQPKLIQTLQVGSVLESSGSGLDQQESQKILFIYFLFLKSIVGIILADCSGHRISQFLKMKEFSQNRNNSATGHWSLVSQVSHFPFVAGLGGQVAPPAWPLTHSRSPLGGVLGSDLDTRYYTHEPKPAFAKICPVLCKST